MAVGHAYSLNTDIREQYMSLLFNMELRRDTQIESILEYTQRDACIITTAISHAYSSYTALQSAGSRSAGYVSARDL